MQLHEDVLRANGGSWRRPPEQVQWGAEHRARLERFIGARQGRPVWGFKDPRTLLVIDGWLEAVPDLDMVATVRHPAAVARSLQRRSGSPSAEPWLELWLDYNRRLLDLHERHAFPIIDFDLPAEEYQARLATLIEGLGLRAPMGKEAFFEPSLRNPTPEDPALTDEIESVYRELCEIAAVSGDGGAGDRADGAGDRADGAEAAAPGEPAGGSGHEPAHRG